ncbi:hypothetical protein [Paenibacillus sp. 481]|uniref:hypothetical protein n=1 Tax=Paenibacillus sp. 481 TaxID=2835869 RepID=UPI001E545994|nr:hypothetical protein [Paenibacillus sp. 481]UHA73270.1 hypothetical protein KIK04_22280 [Paenibacillus sp. 481]
MAAYKDIARMTIKGLKYRNHYYVSNVMTKGRWYDKVRTEGGWYLPIMYNPSKPGEILILKHQITARAIHKDSLISQATIDSYHQAIQEILSKIHKKT